MYPIVEERINKSALIKKGVDIPAYSIKNPAIKGPRGLTKLDTDCTIPITLHWLF